MSDFDDKIFVSKFEKEVEECKTKTDVLNLCTRYKNKYGTIMQKAREHNEDVFQKHLQHYAVNSHREPYIFVTNFLIDEYEIKFKKEIEHSYYNRAIMDLGIQLAEKGYIKQEIIHKPDTLQYHHKLSLGVFKL